MSSDHDLSVSAGLILNSKSGMKGGRWYAFFKGFLSNVHCGALSALSSLQTSDVSVEALFSSPVRTRRWWSWFQCGLTGRPCRPRFLVGSWRHRRWWRSGPLAQETVKIEFSNVTNTPSSYSSTWTYFTYLNVHSAFSKIILHTVSITASFLGLIP